MGELAGTAAKMGGGLITSKQAMKALASVPKEVAVAFKGIPAQLAAAAQKAKLLGHDLKKVQDMVMYVALVVLALARQPILIQVRMSLKFQLVFPHLQLLLQILHPLV